MSKKGDLVYAAPRIGTPIFTGFQSYPFSRLSLEESDLNVPYLSTFVDDNQDSSVNLGLSDSWVPQN